MKSIRLSGIEHLGKLIRQARKETGITQADAAALCNVSVPFLNQVEQGKETARIGKVFAVCARLGIAFVVETPGDSE